VLLIVYMCLITQYAEAELGYFSEEGMMKKEQQKKEKEVNANNCEGSHEITEDVIEEIEIEELTVDGICGVY
jgi:mycofactocin precursor